MHDHGHPADAEAACTAALQQAQALIARGQATAALEQGDGYEGKPPAVILDVDETVLDCPASAPMVRFDVIA